MYHIPQDARAQRSAERIYESLMTFQHKNTLSEISVTEISAAAGIGRSTFYRLFDNTYDVLYWKSEQILKSSMGIASERQSFQDIFKTFISTWMRHKTLLAALLRFSMTDILFQVHYDHIEEIGALFFNNTNLSLLQQEYLSTMLASMMAASFRLLEKHPQTTPEEMLRCFRDALEHLNIMFAADA